MSGYEIHYCTDAGTSAVRIVPDNATLADALVHLHRRRIEAVAYAVGTERKHQTGGVCRNPDTGRLTWWAEQ